MTTKKSRKPDNTGGKQVRSFTKKQQSAIDECSKYINERGILAEHKMKIGEDGASSTIDYRSHEDGLLATAEMWKAFGGGNVDIEATAKLASQVTGASYPRGSWSAQAILENQQLIAGIGAQDAIEAMLATQMVASHNAAMHLMSKAHNAEYISQLESYANQSNKLMRTFATQVETLKRYRQKASQTVRVERVYVNEGGQAIVGDVHTGGGVTAKREEQPHALGYAPGTPMRSENSQGNTLPVTSDEKRAL